MPTKGVRLAALDGHVARESIDTTMTEAIIRAEALTKIVKSGDDPLTILDGVSFAVEPGATIAIVGASGLGQDDACSACWPGSTARRPVKSTSTARRSSALDEDARAAMRQRLLGFVFQSFQLLPALTALENVMLPLELAGADDAEARARTWLERVGLAKRDDALSAAAVRRRTAARGHRTRILRASRSC